MSSNWPGPGLGGKRFRALSYISDFALLHALAMVVPVPMTVSNPSAWGRSTCAPLIDGARQATASVLASARRKYGMVSPLRMKTPGRTGAVPTRRFGWQTPCENAPHGGRTGRGGRLPGGPASTALQTGVRKEKGRLDSAGGGGW